ncbi:MerR family DNA-binding transcriptional regulator [Lysobacter sp. N42]|nr:MerR family DNA-binding transcriptional regulator [Aliidiomarina sp. B3213]TCZ93422.1 MerR family DNA-binding transcriptional regulator [Lysobacter sp. N42]
MNPERVRRTQDTFSIGDLAREFDITTRSIRFYEDQGLLKPERRGQTRIYHQKDRVRLKLILRGKRLGFTLAETKTLFDMYDRDGSSTNQLQIMLELIENKKAALHQQLDDIQVVLHELTAVEAGCRAELEEKSKPVTDGLAPEQTPEAS